MKSINNEHILRMHQINFHHQIRMQNHLSSLLFHQLLTGETKKYFDWKKMCLRTLNPCFCWQLFLRFSSFDNYHCINSVSFYKISSSQKLFIKKVSNWTILTDNVDFLSKFFQFFKIQTWFSLKKRGSY